MTGTVLVVDDEARILEAIEEVLGTLGYRVLVSSDSDRAVAMLEEEVGPIHLLLTDVLMPKHLSGVALAQQVRRRWPDVKVIFMTGHIRETLPEGELPPDARILLKPISFEALVSEVKTVLGPP